MIKQVDQSHVSGTSFHGTTFTVSPKELLLAFPNFEPGCGKTTREWVFEFEGNVFALYDWKETSEYESGLPSYQDFWDRDYIELHIGSSQGAVEEQVFRKKISWQIADILFRKKYEILKVDKVFARSSGRSNSKLILRGPTPLGPEVSMCVARVWGRGDAQVFEKFGLATLPEDWKIQALEKLKQTSSKYREQFRTALLESL